MRALAFALLAALDLRCSQSSPTPPAPAASVSAAARAAEAPAAEAPGARAAACKARIDQATARPSLPGAPAFDQARPEFLGRARAEPVIFVREPRAEEEAAVPAALWASHRELRKGPPGARVVRVVQRHRRDPEALRRLLLREGYLYAPDPHDALALATELHVGDLFDAPEVWHQRGSEISRLELTRVRGVRVYRHADGSRRSHAAELLFGDRVALGRDELASPLHRDLRALAEAEGFDRTKIVHRGEGELVAELRYGSTWAKALLTSEGASLSVGCVAEGEAEAEAHKKQSAPLREALARLSASVTEQVDEELRFDRPEGEKTAERDGQLRPVWLGAYLRSSEAFVFEGHTYPVYDSKGKPWPPQVCVDFVLDSFERSSGTWFTARGAQPARVRGKVDLDAAGIKNRRGVLPFEAFAASRPDLFAVRRFQGPERIAFQHRAEFFRFLAEHADEFRPGDILAIQGRKRDGLIHQHAILLERTDPVTGFPYGLADQMKRPRRRTFEGIMAEAPLRSMLYRIRPADALFGLASGPPG